MNPQQMAAQMQQLKMQNQVLLQEKHQLLNLVERTRAAFEKDKIMESLIAHAVTGYSSQPRAAELCFMQKDHGTGIMAPVTGGPVWVAEMAMATMQEVIGNLEKMATEAMEREEKEEAARSITEGNDGINDAHHEEDSQETRKMDDQEPQSGDKNNEVGSQGLGETISPSGLIQSA